MPTPTQLAAANEMSRIKRARNMLARDSINAHTLIDELSQIKEKLGDCEPTDVARLTAIANINFGLLKKVMPDLKQAEPVQEEKESNVYEIPRSDFAELRQKMLDTVDL